MQLFIGTKQIKATPMTRTEYNEYRGWDLPDDEKHLANESGFLVEYIDGGRTNDKRHGGYISWSPADVFVNSYKSSGELTFGHALDLLKAGHKVTRKGWNGKNMWLILTPGRVVENLEPDSFYDKCGFEAPVAIGSHIDMKAADGSMVVGWLASQTDMLADDWMVVTN